MMGGFSCEPWQCVGVAVLIVVLLGLAVAHVVATAWFAGSAASRGFASGPRWIRGTVVLLAVVAGTGLATRLVAFWWAEPFGNRLAVFALPLGAWWAHRRWVVRE